MLLTSTENESQIVRLLDIGSQQGFHILFWIIPYLLELINGYDDMLVLAVEKIEEPFQRVFFFMSSLIGYLQLGIARDIIERELWAE